MTAENGDTESQDKVETDATEPVADGDNLDKSPEEETQGGASEHAQLPDDHPLVKTLAAQKELIKELKKRPAGDDVGKVDELSQELEDLRKENESLRLAQMRASVAADRGVPAQLLVGSTKEELEAFADALVEFRGQQATTVGLRQSPGQGINSGPIGSGGRSADEIVNAAYQRD